MRPNGGADSTNANDIMQQQQSAYTASGKHDVQRIRAAACGMRSLPVITLALESPKPDQRHELWKQMLSGRVRSFLVGEDKDLAGQLGVAADNYEDLYYGGETPLKFDDGLQNGDRLSAAWRKQMADTLLARPALVQRRRSSTRVTSAVEVFAPYRHPITRQTTKAPITS
ncbi:uncharacterized protein LOC144103406 [Amblyomma americanum]